MTCPKVQTRFSATLPSCLPALSSSTYSSISFIIKGFILSTSTVSDTACLTTCRVNHRERECRVHHSATHTLNKHSGFVTKGTCLEKLDRWGVRAKAIRVLGRVHRLSLFSLGFWVVFLEEVMAQLIVEG